MATYKNTCAHCGRLYDAERSTARYCSPAHRLAAHRRQAAIRSLLLERTVVAQAQQLAVIYSRAAGLTRTDAALAVIDRLPTPLAA